MFRYAILICCILALTSCGSAKKTTSVNNPTTNKTTRIILQAETYLGTPYTFGGTTSKGMDCSGLVYTAFLKEDILLPRVSRDMAKRGKPVALSKIKEGDLVFFRTNKNSRQINHVGLITQVKGRQVFFIHSTSSRGVITTSLDEAYWKKAFVQVRRII